MKKTHMRIILAVIALALLLSACSGKPVSETEGASAVPAAGETNPQEVNAPVDGGLTLVAEELELPEGMAYASAQCLDGDTIWLGGLSENGAVLGSVSLDGETFLVDMPEGIEYVYAACKVDEGIAVLSGSFPSAYKNSDGDTVMNDYPKGRLELLIFDGSAFTSRTALTDAYRGMNFKLMLELEGSYYIQCQDIIVKFSSDGVEQARFTLDSDDALEYIVSMCLCGDQLLAAVGRPLNTVGDSALCYLNLSSLEPEKTTTIKGRLLTGLGVDLSGYILTMDEDGVFSVNSEGEIDVKILKWDDLYISDIYTRIDELENGYLFSSPYQETVYTAQYKQHSGFSERIELTLATDNIYVGSTEAIVNAFNKSQDDYYITVNAYDGFNMGEQDRTMDLLRTEIIAGNSPDIFAFRVEASLSEVRPETVYADLSEFIDNEDSFSRDDFIEVLIDSATKDGALYWLPYRFSIETFTAPESLMGASNMTLEEADKLALDNGLAMMMTSWMTKEDVFFWASRLEIEKYIDWENGTCSFDSDGFIQLLKSCGEWTNGAGDSGDDCLMNWEMLERTLDLARISSSYNGNYCFAGFPTGESSGHLFQIEMRFAISKQCEYKDAAWEFIKFAMSEEGQAEYIGLGFCAIYSMLKEEIDEAVENNVDSGVGEYEYTEADAQKFWELVNNTRISSGANSVIINIMLEEAGAYFAGNKTAEECAKLIQSRVQLYVGEQS